jgi:hypothetical protein
MCIGKAERKSKLPTLLAVTTAKDVGSFYVYWKLHEPREYITLYNILKAKAKNRREG